MCVCKGESLFSAKSADKNLNQGRHIPKIRKSVELKAFNHFFLLHASVGRK